MKYFRFFIPFFVLLALTSCTMMKENRSISRSVMGKTETGINATDLKSITVHPPFSFTYGGKTSKDILKTWSRTVRREKLDRKRTKHTVSYSDPLTGLVVRCEAVGYKKFPAVEWTVYFQNTGNQDTPILEDIQAIDVTLEMAQSIDPILHYSRGGVWAEQAFEPLSKTIGVEESVNLSTLRTPDMSLGINDHPGNGLSSNPYLPFFNVDAGESGLIYALGWSGTWAMELERPDQSKINIQAGMEKTHLKLHPGEEIRTPLVLLLAWEDDWLAGQNLWRRLVLDHFTPQKNGKPVTTPISFTNWGSEPATMHLEKIKRAKEYNLPLDSYWIDAEWFGTPQQGSWTMNVGNWYINKTLYPEGMESISKAAHDAGMDFLLWFEPGRVIKGTEIFKEYPDWILGPGSGSFWEPHWLFDFGNPDALTWMTNRLSSLISEYDVDIFRSDFCFEDPIYYLRKDEAPDRQGMNEIRYVQGFYQLWDDLLERHPGLMIDNCCGGGRMIDLETMKRSVPLWTSDLQVDPKVSPSVCQSHSLGSFYWLPLSGTSAMSPIEPYTCRSNMRSALNVTWVFQKNFTADFPVEQARSILEQAHLLKKYYYGDFYPLTEYSRDDSSWIAYQMNRSDLDEGMVMAFRRPESLDSDAKFKLQGLNRQKSYNVDFPDTGKSIQITGSDLMNNGLSIPILKAPGSALIIYSRK